MEKVDLIAEINAKYMEADAELDKKLEKVKRDEENLSKLLKDSVDLSSSDQPAKVLTYEEAKIRNSKLLKSFEMSKARLRSRSTFSPVEQLLAKAIENYKKDVALHNPPANINVEQ